MRWKRRYTALGAAVLLCGTLGVGLGRADDGQDGAVVHTKSGPIKGEVGDDSRRFRGVPYAAPPTDDLRWRAPEKVQPWSEIRDATKPAKRCGQNTSAGEPDPDSSEDCLYLEVTTPRESSAEPRPVMVWMHGGGLFQGDGAQFDATRMAARGDVVVVSINYRLGVFGFYGHTGLRGSASFGLQDQQAALRWVRANASAFGGDADNVTLFGESAGGISTCGQLASPHAAGLFDKAILQSGTCSGQPWMVSMGYPEPEPTKGTFWPTVEEVADRGQDAAEELGCRGDDAKVLACLRGLPPEELLPVTERFAQAATGTRTLPVSPATAVATGAVPDMPMIVGTTRDEARFIAAWVEYPDDPVDADRFERLTGTAFGDDAEDIRKRYPLSDRELPSVTWSTLDTDRSWLCPQLSDGRELSSGEPVYAYEFADRTAPPIGPFPPESKIPPGASHGSELEYLFATGVRDWDGPIELTPEQRELGDAMIGYWTRFAHSGDPNGGDAPQWPMLDASNSPAQSLDQGPNGIKPVDTATAHQCEFWDAYDGRT